MPFFSSMLKRGNPPDDWSGLLKECISPDALQQIGKTISDESE